MSDVFLMEYTPNPEKLVVLAAKLCYSDKDIMDLNNIVDKLIVGDNEIPYFINILFKMGHLSPFEHANFTFGLKCSRSCSLQWVRSRIASHSQRSQRYVSEKQFKSYIPKSILESKHLEKFNNLMVEIQNVYNAMDDIPSEDKRSVLPNACQTQLITTMNARELIHFFNVRCCNRAQSEIRFIATKMLYLVRQVAPNIFGNAGPNCISGKCPEGKMTCGKSSEIKDIFDNDDILFFEMQKIKDNEIND